MSETYTEIATRLLRMNPPIKIADHIGARSKLKVAATVLDGISFQAKDHKQLIAELRAARDQLGNKAFSEARIDNEPHWALKLSFGATEGTGFRETWRFPPLSDRIAWERRPGSYGRQHARNYNGQFGDVTGLPNLTSLHCAVSIGICNIHIDQTGFVLEGLNNNISLTPDFAQHLVNELLFKTYAKEWAPGWAKKAFDRVSLVYPNTANNFSRMGPRIGQVPFLRRVGNLPGVGPVLSRVPLPGVSVDVIQAKTYKLQAMASCGVNGDCSATVTFGGTHDLFGSK